MSTPPAGKPGSAHPSIPLPIPEQEEEKTGKFLNQQVTTLGSEASPRSSDGVVMRENKGSADKAKRRGFRTAEELGQLAGEYEGSGNTSSPILRSRTMAVSREGRKAFNRQRRSSLSLESTFQFSNEDLEKIKRDLMQAYQVTDPTQLDCQLREEEDLTLAGITQLENQVGTSPSLDITPLAVTTIPEISKEPR